MFDLFQPTRLLFILLVALLVFGPKRLAQASQDLGRTIRGIQEHKEEVKEGLLNTSEEDELEKKRSMKKG